MKTKKTMKIKSTTKTFFILTIILFFGLCFSLLDFNSKSEITLAQSFTCNSGNLSTTCYINTSHNITGETISGSGNLEIQNGGNLYTDQGPGTTAIINIGGNVEIKTGGKIDGNINLTATNLTIESGASINANQKGYGSESGPGKGVGNTSSTITTRLSSGAGYGGKGGTGIWSSWAGGAAYGSLTEPTDIGSGGGDITAGAHGGSGGGAIKLDITGTLKVDGSITSNGGNGISKCKDLSTVSVQCYCGGGGSGGSIWIIADTLTGGGSIIANGGSGTYIHCFGAGGWNADGKGSGAGGGRIGIDICENDYTGTINVLGGVGYNDGGTGTINYGPCSCAFESESCSSISCCSSPPAPEPLTCVDNICRSCISKNCSANNAKDHSISSMGDAIDDVYCTWNIHDGCLVKSGVATVNGCNGIPSYWEAESCDSNDTIIFRNGAWYIDIDRNQSTDISFWYGITGDIPLMADYDGDGTNDIIAFRNGRWYIDTNRDHITDISFWYGALGHIPLMADYDGDGTNDIIVFSNGLWFIDTNRDHIADISFCYGLAGDKPLLADYNSDGVKDIIIFRNGLWYIDTDRNQSTDINFWYGITGDIPLMADYNGGGKDIIAFRNGAWYIDIDRNQSTDISFGYGITGDIPLMADYDGDGGTSDLWGEKKVYIDDINDYNIKVRCGVDDSAQVWINDNNAGIPFVCCSYGGWTDVTNKFITGWNTIKFKAVDTCGDDAWGSCGGRWFDLNWDISSNCAFEGESCLSTSCCSSPPAPEPLTCVDNTCRTCVSKNCSADNAEDNSISEMGDAIDDVYCTWNIHDGCLVKEGVATVNGCNGIPSYWEPESCGGDAGTSDLWGEKKVYIDDINDYNIKVRGGVDDSAQVWINDNDAGIPFICCAYGGWTDVTSKFTTGWNTIKFKAVDTCGDDAWGSCGGRWFDLNWKIIPRAPALNGIAVSNSEISLSWSDRGAGVTYNVWNFDSGSYIYIGNQTSFDHEGLDSNTTYSYKITATKNGYDSEWSNTISATTWNQLPVTNAGPSQFVVLGNSVNLNGSGSNDPDGDPISYDWTFNSIPGASSLTDADFSDETIVNPTFTPDVIGVYLIDLNVTDSYGGFDTDTVSITVANPPPVCGNNVVEGSEECDGTDKDACGEQYCIPVGQPGECTCQKPMPAWKEVKPKRE